MNDSSDTKQATGPFSSADHSTQEWVAGQSAQRLKPGLYLVATPIGNLRDITLRALDILDAAETVYCEDTRVTQRLLSVFGLHKRLERCDDHTEKRRVEEIVTAVRAGKIVAFVSDAGTPGISDPGSVLVTACREAGIYISPVPGPSAAIATISIAGLDASTPFTFLGFLPVKSGARRKLLRDWGEVPSALLFYEAPQRVADTLDDIAAMLGQRRVLIAREVTKLHEEFYVGTPDELQVAITADVFKGEVALLVYPDAGQTQTDWNDAAIDNALRGLLGSMSLKEAVAQVTAQSGLSRKIVYARALALGR